MNIRLGVVILMEEEIIAVNGYKINVEIHCESGVALDVNECYSFFIRARSN
jgi:hypothetical protein